MTPYPDNFSGEAFDRKYGPNPHHGAINTRPITAAAGRLIEAAKVFVAALDAEMDVFKGVPHPSDGYGIDDIRQIASELADVDPAEYEARLTKHMRDE